MRWNITFPAIAMFLLVSLFTPVSAETVTVCASGCDNTTIQDAVDYASSGDTISVGSGIYTEQVLIDKPLNLIGTDAEIRLPDSGLVSHNWNSGNYPTVGVDTTTGVNISGFVVNSTGHDTGSYSGVHFWKSSGNVSNCIFYGYQDAVISNHVWDVSYPTHVDITYNTFNVCPSGCNGITCTEMDADCYIYGNTVEGVATSNIGIQIGYGATGDIISNDVSGISDSECIMLSGGVDGSTISYNTIDNCESGIFLYYDGSYGYGGNDNTDILHNTISNSVYGIYIEEDSINTTVGWNNLTGCDTNIQSEETVIFTVGDNICESKESNFSNLFYLYGFENLSAGYNQLYGEPTFEELIVDNSFNYGINETATWINITGNSSFNSLLIQYEFGDLGLNQSSGFPINAITVDFFNTTIVGEIYDILFWVQYIDEEENMNYGSQFHPLKDGHIYVMSSEDNGDSTITFVKSIHCNAENLTSDEGISVDCGSIDTEMIDKLQFIVSGWNLSVDFVVDNLRVSNIVNELSLNSPDCAIPVSNISYLYENLGTQQSMAGDNYKNNYITLNAVNVGSLSGLATRQLLRGYSPDNWFMPLKDYSSSLIMIGLVGSETDYAYRTILNNQTIPTFDTELLEVTGFIFGSEGYIPEDINIYIYNITPLGTAPDDYYSYDIYPNPLEVEPTTLSYAVTKFSLNPSTNIYYYSRHNETHIYRKELNTGTYIFYEITTEELRHTTTNYTTYLIQYPEFEAFQDGSQTATLIFEEYNEKMNFSEPKMWISREFLINQNDEELIGVYNFLLANHNNLKYTDIIGDGICGSLESSYPSDWNYSPDCRFGGTTGYAVAIGLSTLQGLMLVGLAVFLLLFLATAAFFTDSFDLGGIVSTILVVTAGIAMIAVGALLIITP